MTLGEKIAKLRAGRRMSQGDLAEALHVSRQSVSKWETGASIPDLERLLLLSDLFQISMDDLVRDGAPASAPSAPAAAPPAAGASTQRTVGFLLLAVGLLGGLLGILFSLWLLLLSVYLLLCGALCVAFRRPVGLLILWATLLPVFFALPLFTGVRLGAVFNPVYYQHAPPINLVMSFVIWAMLLALVSITARRTRLRTHTALVIGWVVFSQMWGYLPFLFNLPPYYERVYLIPATAALLLLGVLVFFTGRALVAWRRGRGHADIG